MNTTMTSGPATARLMYQVMLALLPGSVVMSWFFGWGVVLNIALAIGAAAAFEALALALRRKPLKLSLYDGSACLTGWLLALALPPLLPWWITVIGAAAAILLAKQLYGGLGYNPFNPAMVGYALLLVSFPRDMTLWPAPATGLSLPEVQQFTLSGRDALALNWDALTRATPLEQLPSVQPADRLPWQLVNLAYLCGGVYLLFRRVISWHIPGALLLTLALAYALDYLLFDGPVSPAGGLFSGAAMLGAFFIATDPVSAATSPRGRLVYAAGIGLLIFVIRKWGHYPDGVAFAILLMNLSAPAIDYFYRPRAFGQ